jgi:hypothetical protein
MDTVNDEKELFYSVSKQTFMCGVLISMETKHFKREDKAKIYFLKEVDEHITKYKIVDNLPPDWKESAVHYQDSCGSIELFQDELII